MIRIFLADDHAMLRDGLRRVIEETADLAVAGETGDGAELLRRAAQESWDVLVLDLSLPGASGLDLLRQVRQVRPHLPILVLTMHAEDPYALRILNAGAAGYLTKGRPASMLLEALRKVHRGGRYITPELAELMLLSETDPARPAHESLTERQIEVLVLVGRGASPSEIANTLGLRASTISTHLNQIKQKLGLRTIGELAQYALQAGLVPR